MAAGKYLPIYLNDHFAGAVAGVKLVRRAARANADSVYRERLAVLAEEINEDRHSLQRLLKDLGVRGDPVKILASVGAELWRALRVGLAEDPRADGIDFGELIERATSQRRRLQNLHKRAVEEAF